ncbi:hypothetical protein MTR67_029891 [Solanum verrucosum]|uniref:Multidrug and toxic compound extrusion protein n=1 Tax=Solanum verrucosum TaxID=315347 RepID=A0AAF0RDB1_SOLVR|nr:hypothetical protein MTR67_029891 [Solanum verrucosum]
MDIEERKEDLECPNLGIERKYDEIFVQVKKLLVLAGPLMLVNILLYSLQVISVMFVGHQGELALSGASMATSFAFVTGFGLLMGMGSALETLCGQSYGANQYHMLGIHMQRAMFVNLLASIPLACIWANAGRILVILRQDPEIAAEAGIYARFMIPSIFAYGLLECQIRFLQAQNNVVPMMLTAGGTALLHVFGCWILVLKSGLGSRGAALANATSYWINVFSLVAYIKISPSFKSTWTGFSTEAFSDIPRYLKLAVPSALMICLNTSAMVHMLPQGLGGATSVRVSNELGAGRPKIARLVARTATILATTEGILVAIVMVSIRKVWGHCYSNEEEIVKYVGKMCFFLAGSHFLDAHQSIFSGIARGCGWQKIGAYVNLGAFYLWGIPIGIVLAFVCHVGGKGLWLGIILAISAQVVIYSVIILRTNWDEQAKKAAVRVTQEST